MQPLPARALPAPRTAGGGTWISFNLYSERQDELLLGAAAPAVARLLENGLAQSFFFIRYFDDDGAHLRVRLRVEEGAVERAGRRFSAAVEERAQPEWLAPERGRPWLTPSEIELEVDRYGGPAAHADSLRFFGVSSVHAVHFTGRYHAHRPVQRLALAMTLLLWQALGYARDAHELHGLLDYFQGWRERMADVVAAADSAFDRDPQSWRGIVRAALRRLAGACGEAGGEAGSAGALAGASRALSGATAGLPPPVRLELARSQLHMTANRIGLSNRWESYLSRLLCRAAAAVKAGDDGLRSELERKVAEDAAGAEREPLSLSALHDLHLSRFVRAWSGSAAASGVAVAE